MNYLPKGLVEKLKELNEQGQIKKSDIILGILLGLVMTVLTIIGMILVQASIIWCVVNFLYYAFELSLSITYLNATGIAVLANIINATVNNMFKKG